MKNKGQFKKGSPGFIGKHTEESKLKMRLAHLGRKESEEQKLKISRALKGIKKSKETRNKMALANLGKILSKEIRLKISKSHIGKKLEKDNPSWKGDKVGYISLHQWIRSRLGIPSKCSNDSNHKVKKYFWANISGDYKRDIFDWHSLCPSCNKTDGIKIHSRFLKK